MARKADRQVLAPNLGVYYDRPSIAIPARGLKDARNVRVRNGQLVRDNMGWAPFPNADTPIDLVDPVMGIYNFTPRAGGQFLLLCTTRDIYVFNESTDTVSYLTPRYATGTVSVTNGSPTVTGSGTTWSTNLKAGDFIHVGDAVQRDPTATWYEIDSVDSNTQITLTANYAETTAAGEVYTARKTFTGDVFDPWVFETFPSAVGVGVGSDGDRWYATNGQDPVVAWTNTLTEVYEPAIGLDAAKWLRRFSNVMVYGDITVSSDRRPYSIRTSDLGKPEDTTNGLAAEFVVHDGSDPLLTAEPLGDALVLYAERSVTLAQFVGEGFVFIFRKSVHGLGPVSSRAVVNFGDYHEFLGPDSKYRYDGVQVQESGQHVMREVLRRATPSRLPMAFVHIDEENGEALWVVPQNTDPDLETGPPASAFTEHYLEEVGRAPKPFMVRDLAPLSMGFFERELTLTWDQISQAFNEINFRWDDRFLQAAFPFNLFGAADGKVYILNEWDSQNGADLNAFVRFGRRPLGDVMTKGLVRRVHVFTHEVEGDLDVTLHTSSTVAGATAASAFQLSMRAGQENAFLSPRVVGRYLELELGTNGAGKPFYVDGYSLDVVPAGRRG